MSECEKSCFHGMNESLEKVHQSFRLYFISLLTVQILGFFSVFIFNEIQADKKMNSCRVKLELKNEK